MYPYYKKDIESGAITRTAAQELLDCIWVKLNDLNKCRDAASAEGFRRLQSVPEPDRRRSIKMAMM